MTVHSDTRASMLAQIMLGNSKESSHLVTDEETSAAWDDVAKGLAETRAKHPDAKIDVPLDI